MNPGLFLLSSPYNFHGNGTGALLDRSGDFRALTNNLFTAKLFLYSPQLHLKTDQPIMALSCDFYLPESGPLPFQTVCVKCTLMDDTNQ